MIITRDQQAESARRQAKDNAKLQEAVRNETEAFLRELAFVLRMTAEVKRQMVRC